MRHPLFKIKYFLGCLWFVSTMAWSNSPTHWQTLAPGLEYAAVTPFQNYSLGAIHAFRFNLKDFDLKFASAKDYGSASNNVAVLVQRTGALVGANGGFFAPDFTPLGLRINNGVVVHNRKAISWWGVFYVQGSRAYIVPQQDFKPNAAISFALQSGPRLLINGETPKLKPGIDNRTLLCITKDKKVILAATEHLPLTTTQLAEIIKSPQSQGGLDCVDAINLDGGSSSQIYAKINRFELNVEGMANVADVVLIVPKRK